MKYGNGFHNRKQHLNCDEGFRKMWKYQYCSPIFISYFVNNTLNTRYNYNVFIFKSTYCTLCSSLYNFDNVYLSYKYFPNWFPNKVLSSVLVIMFWLKSLNRGKFFVQSMKKRRWHLYSFMRTFFHVIPSYLLTYLCRDIKNFTFELYPPPNLSLLEHAMFWA